jgi:hypothetical protein
MNADLNSTDKARLDRIADRGSARGAEEVLDAARRSTSGLTSSPYVSPASAARRRAPVLALVAVLGMALVGLAAWAAMGASDQGSSEDVASVSSEGSTTTSVDDELQVANDVLEAQLAAGWVPAAFEPGATAVEVPEEMWVRMDAESIAPPDLDPELRRVPVYDAPDGQVIGYNYLSLGFIPLDMADDFDGAAARVARYGCDVELDQVCGNDHARELMEQAREDARTRSIDD